MAKKDKKIKPAITANDLHVNRVFNDVMGKISTNTYKNPIDNITQIDKMEIKVQNVINDDIDELKTYGGNDLSTFLVRTLAANDKVSGSITNLNKSSDNDSLESIFLSKDGGVFAAFNERFKNKALLFNDLEIISEQLVEITEALNTTRDDIVCSDDIGAEISRTLNFSTDTANREKYDDLIDEVKRVEKDLRLNHKIREHIIPKTLKYGEYYVYVIPESKLYENSQKKLVGATKSITMESSDVSVLCENLQFDEANKPKDDEVKMYINETLTNNINVNNNDLALPLLENTGSMNAIMDLGKYTHLTGMLKGGNKSKSNKKSKPMDSIGFSDGVKSTNNAENWDGVKGCYIKLLDPKKVIPVKMMDYIIGYYYINDSDFESNNASVNGRMCKHTAITGNMLDNVVNKTSNEKNIIGAIANSIVKSFNKDYLEKNTEFKDLIISSLLYNDLYKRKLHYQFIPADNICRFTVNEDEHGNGQSMLYRSLFYAKLFLSVLIFNTVTYLSKSQDTRINYVKTSGIDKNTINKTMEIARKIKSKQISISDLMDYSSIYGKIGTGRDVYMPVGESGERGIEFDVIAGQQIDMQTEFMENLKQSYINGTGVPSVIMNYINEADYAKTLVMANAKHMRRVMLYQDSFNESLTNMYRLILYYCTDMDISDIQEFRYTLQRPKSLPTNNLVDIMGYGDQMLDFMDKSVFGQYANDDSVNAKRDMFRDEMSRKILPMLPWDEVDEVLEKIAIEKAKVDAKKAHSEDGADGGADTSGDPSQW